MDGIARLEATCRQVPETACYQYHVFMLPSDLSIIQPAHECACEWAASLSASPYWVDFPILINQALSRELVINSEVIMSCFNHSLIDSRTLSTHMYVDKEMPKIRFFSQEPIDGDS